MAGPCTWLHPRSDCSIPATGARFPAPVPDSRGRTTAPQRYSGGGSPPSSPAMARARRRRKSDRYEGASSTRRFTRHSLPEISYDGLVHSAGVGIASAEPTGARLRRGSNLAFSLPGVTGVFMHAGEEGGAAPDGGDETLLLDTEYQFPIWWFVILTLPGFFHTLFGNALWGVIWPNLLSQMAGKKYKALALAAGAQICTVVGFFHPVIGSMSDNLSDEKAKYFGRRRPFILLGSFIMSFGVWMTYDALYRIVDRPAVCVVPGNVTHTLEQYKTCGACTKAHCKWEETPISHSHLIFAYVELAASLVVGNGGSAIFSPPFTAIIADTIPLRQRGMCVMIQSWTSTVTAIGGGAVAYMASEQLSCSLSPPPYIGETPFPIDTEQWSGACFSAKDIWWADIWVLLLQCPLYLICCNGQACDGWSLQGIWKPEKFVKRVERAVAVNDVRPRCQRWMEDLREFLVAFRDPTYKWFWLYGLLGHFASIFVSQFALYWYQDCFMLCTGCCTQHGQLSGHYNHSNSSGPTHHVCAQQTLPSELIMQGAYPNHTTHTNPSGPTVCLQQSSELILQGACDVVKFDQKLFQAHHLSAPKDTECTTSLFFLFGTRVANNAGGAASFLATFSQVLHIVMMPLIRPDYWRDRFGGRPLLIWTGFLSLGLLTPFVYAHFSGRQNLDHHPLFTIIIVWQIWSMFLGCVATAAGGALMMDCLPSTDDGRPISASRDLALHEWAQHIPKTGFPLLAAMAFVTPNAVFPTHIAAYQVFYCIGGVVGFVTCGMFIFLVHPKEEHLDKSFQCTRHWYWAEYDKRRRLGLVGPEMRAAEDAAAHAHNEILLAKERQARMQKGLPPDDFEVTPGARCCDQLLFGRGWCGDAEEVYVQAYIQQSRASKKQNVPHDGSVQ
jgi:hypothetical protein